MDNMQLWLISSTDSINLNSGADGFYLNPDLDGLTGLPEIRSSNGVNGGYDGGWTSTQLWDARLITIRGLIVDKDGSVVEAKRKQLAKLVGQGKKDPLTLKFVSEAGHTYTCTVRTTNCTMALQNVYSRQEYQIQLRADDPLIYDDGGDDVQATLRVQTDSEGFDIPFDIPLDISGGADPVVVDAGEDANYPVITMYGELHSPTIVNQTTNQQLQLGADLGGSSLEWTEFDTASGSSFQIQNGTQYDAPLTLTEITGNATQNGTPTPNAPVAVNTTTGENVVKITGKNLCYRANSRDAQNIEFYFSGLRSRTFTLAFTTNETLNNNSIYLRSVGNIQWHNWGIVGTVSCSSGTRVSCIITLTEQIYSELQDVIKAGGVPLLMLYKSGANFRAPNDAQLELGSTATAYEPYQGQSYEVNLGGTNLVNQSELIAGYVQNNGYPTVSQTQAEMRTDYIEIEPNTTYTFSIQATTDTYTSWFGWCEYTGQTPTTVIGSRQVINSNPATFTTSATAKYVILSARNLQNATKVQLEKRSTATPYVPYVPYQIELAKIGNYQDRIYKTDGKWYIEKQVGKVVLDGSEGWRPTSGNSNYFYIEKSDVGFAPSDSTVGAIMSNNYTATTANRLYSATDDYGIAIRQSPNHQIWIRNKDCADKASFVTWLSTHPTTVYYALATPTTTEITDSTLLAQLNFIANLYGGTNNIMLVGTGAQGEIEVQYGTDYIEIPADVAVIDCKDRTVMLNGANAYNLLAEGSEFIRLAPGENKLYLTSESTSDSGYAEVKFKTGNLSI